MRLSGLFEKKIEGNIVFVIKIKTPAPYPEKDVRWKKYGNPLGLIFNPYFEEIMVEYYQDEKNRLDQIDVVCYKSSVKYKKSEENEFFANILKLVSEQVVSFFNQMNMKAQIEKMHAPSESSLLEHGVQFISKKVEGGKVLSDSVDIHNQENSDVIEIRDKRAQK